MPKHLPTHTTNIHAANPFMGELMHDRTQSALEKWSNSYAKLSREQFLESMLLMSMAVN